MHNETPPVVTVRVCNPDCPPLTINRRNAGPTETGFAEIVSDYFPVLHTAPIVPLLPYAPQRQI
jgi:hypothetical protein